MARALRLILIGIAGAAILLAAAYLFVLSEPRPLSAMRPVR